MSTTRMDNAQTHVPDHERVCERAWYVFLMVIDTEVVRLLTG